MQIFLRDPLFSRTCKRVNLPHGDRFSEDIIEIFWFRDLEDISYYGSRVESEVAGFFVFLQ